MIEWSPDNKHIVFELEGFSYMYNVRENHMYFRFKGVNAKLSADGERMLYHNDSSLRLLDLRSPRKFLEEKLNPLLPLLARCITNDVWREIMRAAMTITESTYKYNQ